MKSMSVALSVLLLSATSFALPPSRDLRPIERLMSETAQYDHVAGTPSEVGHAKRMRAYIEARSLSLLGDKLFQPEPDSTAVLSQIRSVVDTANSYLSVQGRQEVEQILVESVSKDARADAARRPQRDVEILVEQFARQEASGVSYVERQAYTSALSGLGQLLDLRTSGDVCARSTEDLTQAQATYERLASDSYIASGARRIYEHLADIVRAELARRLQVNPVACVSGVPLRRSASYTQEPVDPSLGVFIEGLKSVDVSVDSYGSSNIYQLSASLEDSSDGYYVSIMGNGSTSARIEVRDQPSQERRVRVRFAAYDYNHNLLGRTVIPVILRGDIVRPIPPAEPYLQNVTVILDKGTAGIVKIADKAQVDLTKGNRVLVRGDLQDQYKLSMGEAPADIKIINDPMDRLELLPTQNGKFTLFAKNVSDYPERSEVGYVVATTFAKLGQPLQASGSFFVRTVFPSFTGFNSSEARSIVQRLYLAILQREPDPSGGQGYEQVLLKKGLEGLKQAAYDIGRSPEFFSGVGKPGADPAQIVNSLYRHLLDRAPDPSGGAGAQQQVAQGKTGDVARSMVGSAEFRNNIIGH